MAVSESTTSISLIAGEDLSGDLFKCAKINSSGEMILVAATTDAVNGIVGEEVANGVSGNLVLLTGRILVKAGATVTAGQLAVPADDGRVTGVADIAAIPTDSMSIGTFIDSGVANDVVAIAAFTLATAGVT